MIKLFLNEIKDRYIRENFQKLSDLLANQPFLSEKSKWTFFQYTFAAAVTNFTIPHGLKFIPKDVVQLSATDGMVVTWNFSEFDRTNINVTTDGPGTVRAVIGYYQEG